VNSIVANEVISLHETPREVSPFTNRFPGLTNEDAYEIARSLHEHRLAAGWRVVGRKIGFSNRTIWPLYGIREPMWGLVYDQTLIHADDNRCTVSLAGLVNPRIEPEVCFGLKASPPRSSDPQRLLEAIDWVGHSVEIVQCHYPGWKFQLPDCIIDNALHARLVVGARFKLQALPGLVERLPEIEAVLKRNEVDIDRGVGANVLGSPLLALSHLVDVLAKQPDAPPLQPGEIVTTGVITDAHPVTAGETWRTEISGLPLHGLTVSFQE
jgi:2-keto-4-pentenoate hydratase